MTYQPIENYGLIGDKHTVALVPIDGSIDRRCTPTFDLPAVFAAMLDDKGDELSADQSRRGLIEGDADVGPGSRERPYLAVMCTDEPRL